MVAIVTQNPGRNTSEPETDRQRRIEREAAIIAKAHAEIDAGLGIENDEMEAWLDRLEHDEFARLPGRLSSPL